MRLDKYLKNSRIIKRRTVAKDACEQGRVEVNGKVAKPGLELKIGDVIQVTFGSNVLRVRVLAMPEAVRKSAELARHGDKVLLSPACASWDMYDNFEQRGRHFKNCIKELLR